MDKREQVALDVINAVDDQLIAQYGLTGVGVGLKVVDGKLTDEPCVKLFVPAKLPKDALPEYAQIPRRLSVGAELRTGLRMLGEGGPQDAATDVEVMPPVSAPPWRDLETEDFQYRLTLADTRRYRPVAPGQSVSHVAGTLGTVTAIVTDLYDENRLAILSCNHVLGQLNYGRTGDPIVQPAKNDGGSIARDVCAHLNRYVPIRFSQYTPNYCDAAIARVWLPPDKLLAMVPWIGSVKSTRSGNSLRPGESVYKVGRTTGMTTGKVLATNVSVWVDYPPVLNGVPGAYALFKNQIITTGIAGFGDSGSLVVDEQKRAIGMLFGGTKERTLINDIEIVQKQIGIKLFLGNTCSGG
jgi:hypothetical protein